MVDIGVFIADGFSNPAPSQSFTKHSPMSKDHSVWLVTAIMTMSCDMALQREELQGVSLQRSGR